MASRDCRSSHVSDLLHLVYYRAALLNPWLLSGAGDLAWLPENVGRVMPVTCNTWYFRATLQNPLRNGVSATAV